MGCLPLLIFLPLGFGVGYLLGGSNGAWWGAGFGFVLGVLLMGWLIKALRRQRSGIR